MKNKLIKYMEQNGFKYYDTNKKWIKIIVLNIKNRQNSSIIIDLKDKTITSLFPINSGEFDELQRSFKLIAGIWNIMKGGDDE